MGRPKKAVKKERQPTAMAIKARPEWDEWLAAFADKLGCAKSEVIDTALEDLARKHGFRKPPSRY